MIKKSFVLSGGGCRGFAHLGVIKALNEYGIYPLEIAGTSAGALVGAFIANGFTPDEIKELFNRQLRSNLLAWNGFNMGMLSMKHIREFLVNNLRYTTFEELPIPLFITASNFEDGRQRIFNKGSIIDMAIAASSIPVLFPPVFIDNIPYVDGGMSNNLPVEPFIERKEEVISVYVNPVKPFDQNESFIQMMDRALHLCFRELIGRSAAGCYMYIEPADLNKFGLFEFHKLDDIFDAGYNYTLAFLKARAENKFTT